MKEDYRKNESPIEKKPQPKKAQVLGDLKTRGDRWKRQNEVQVKVIRGGKAVLFQKRKKKNPKKRQNRGDHQASVFLFCLVPTIISFVLARLREAQPSSSWRDDKDKERRDQGGRDRYPREDRDRYPREERDRYPREDRERIKDDRYGERGFDRYGGDKDRDRFRDERDRRDRKDYDSRDRKDYDSRDNVDRKEGDRYRQEDREKRDERGGDRERRDDPERRDDRREDRDRRRDDKGRENGWRANKGGDDEVRRGTSRSKEAADWRKDIGVKKDDVTPRRADDRRGDKRDETRSSTKSEKRKYFFFNF